MTEPLIVDPETLTISGLDVNTTYKVVNSKAVAVPRRRGMVVDEQLELFRTMARWLSEGDSLASVLSLGSTVNWERFVKNYRVFISRRGDA